MMKRRLEISALLLATSTLAMPRAASAQAAPAPGGPGADAAPPPIEVPKGPDALPPGEKPPEALAKPESEPDATPPEAQPAAPAPTEAPAAEAKVDATSAAPAAPAGDYLPRAGYVPGYRSYVGVSASPYLPRVGSLPGGMTPSFGSQAPSDDWSFTFSGFMSASVRASINERARTAPGQSKLVLHAAPTTVDSYGSFNDTGATPGNWVGMLFQYGNRYVTANVSFDTYNPTRGTNYRSIGSQYFINDTFLSFRAPRLGALQLAWNVGAFTQNFGRLGQYGGGLYNPPLIGTTAGVGEFLTAEYDLGNSLTLIVEDGFGMSPRTGKIPEGVVNSAASNFSDANAPAGFIHHAHVGIRRAGDTTMQLMGHVMSNFTRSDEVAPRATDNPDTRQWDESNPRDGSVHVLGLEARAISQSYGYLAFGGALIKAKNAYRVRGLSTYAQDGVRLTQDWLGETTGGTGSIWVAAINYRASLGAILRAPTPFWGDAPDVVAEASFQIAGTHSDDKFFDGRIKQKAGLDVLYTFIPWMGVGGRFDRISPNSEDAEETFHVLQARLQFRSNWSSHETVTLRYAKWFYGDRTHGDGWDARPREQLDDQMIGLGFGMWW